MSPRKPSTAVANSRSPKRGLEPSMPANADPAHHREMLAVLKQFRVVIASMKAHYRDVEREAGLSGAQLWALCAIAANPGMKVGDLALELAIHQSTVSNLLDRLAELGHIERRREGVDQRVVTVHLTDLGRNAVKRAPQPAIGILQNALLALPSEQLQALQNNLSELIHAIGVKRNAGAATPISMFLQEQNDTATRTERAA